MTNKEAIAILTHNWKYRELIDNSYQYEALDLAIKALEKTSQGEWLWVGFFGDKDKFKWSCSLCGRGVEHQVNICPQCGANMHLWEVQIGDKDE